MREALKNVAAMVKRMSGQPAIFNNAGRLIQMAATATEDGDEAAAILCADVNTLQGFLGRSTCPLG